MNPATSADVAIQLAPVEDPPVATDQALSVVEDTPTALALNASDPDGDPLTFTIVAPPAHGTVTVAGTTVTYAPAHDYNGSDSVRYQVSDGQLSSGVATVQLTVTPVNDPPVATSAQVTTWGTSRAPITLAATDVDSTSLTYAIATQPSHGTLTGTPPAVIYKASAGYAGDDTFTFTANDGAATSAPATITVHVLAPEYTTSTVASGLASTPLPVLVTASTLYYAVVPTSGPPTVYATDGTAAGTHLVFTATSAWSSAFTTSRAFSIAGADVVAYSLTSGNVTIARLGDGAVLATIANPDPATYTSVGVIGRPSLGASAAYLMVSWTNGSGGQIAEIWSTDGTAAGTTRLYQLGAIAGKYLGLWELGGHQYFFSGLDLMTMTGATTAPSVLTSLPTGATVIWGYPAAGVLFFEVDQKQSCTNGCDPARELYRSDGTAAGSSVIATVDASFISYGLFEPTDYNGHLYFANARDLYAAGPVATGTTVVATLPANSWSGTNLSGLAAPGGELFFINRNDFYPNPTTFSIYISDGTGAGTIALHTWGVGTYVSGTAMAFDSRTFLTVSDAQLGAVLWRTDNTTAGTLLEVDAPVQALLGVVSSKLLVALPGGIVTAIYRP